MRKPPSMPENKTTPYALQLEPGDYAWCACGLSQQQPFCDGSHADTAIEPKRFTVRSGEGVLWLCGCKKTRDAPLCDGSHNR